MYYHSHRARGVTGITSSAKAILMILADHADQNGRWKIGLAGICDEACVSKSTAIRRIAELEKKGHIRVRRARTKHGENQINEYHLFPEKKASLAPKLAAVRPPEPSPEGGSATVTLGSVAVAPLDINIDKRLQDTLPPPGKRGVGSEKEPKPGDEVAIKKGLTAIREAKIRSGNALLDFFTSCGVELFDISALPQELGLKHPMIHLRKAITLPEVLASQHLMQAFNSGTGSRAGKLRCDIYIRPARYDKIGAPLSHAVFLLDDLKPATVAIELRVRSCVAVETSKDNFQLWVQTSRAMDEDERGRLQEYLARLYEADRASTGGEHFGRMQGHMHIKRLIEKGTDWTVPPALKGVGDYRINPADFLAPWELDSRIDPEFVAKQAAAGWEFAPQRPGGQHSHAQPNTPEGRKATPAQQAKPERSAAKQSRPPRADGVDHSAQEFGYTLNALRAGVSEHRVRENLLSQCACRRDSDAPRYVERTVMKAKEILTRGDA